MAAMNNELVMKYTSQRKVQATTLAYKSSVKMGSEILQADPQLLFQRMVVAASSIVNTEKVFS